MADAAHDPGPDEAAGLEALPTQLGPYRLVRKIGAGAMGTVWLAEEEGRQVALKILHPHLSERRGFFKRFGREARAGRRVRHANVVRTLDSDLIFENNRASCVLVMEYVEGRTLRDLLRDLGTVPETLLREIARQVAAGLEAIHAEGLVHRDLKPDNVLITKDHQVRIMDLGIAKEREASTAITKEGQFAGSLLYAAPEQIRHGDVGPAADLYALGVTLFELAAGKNPFRYDDAAAVMHAHLEDVAPPMGDVCPDVSAFFASVVMTLLAKDVAQRFASAATLRNILEEGERSVWWAARERETKPALPAIPVRRETKIYGRETDLALLEASWAKARNGEGQSVLLEGEAGIGKTRAVDAFLKGLD
ncbi:MAG: serine/threonine-protein kinase, partial [Planctomycetota bacterium]